MIDQTKKTFNILRKCSAKNRNEQLHTNSNCFAFFSSLRYFLMLKNRIKSRK